MRTMMRAASSFFLLHAASRSVPCGALLSSTPRRRCVPRDASSGAARGFPTSSFARDVGAPPRGAEHPPLRASSRRQQSAPSSGAPAAEDVVGERSSEPPSRGLPRNLPRKRGGRNGGGGGGGGRGLAARSRSLLGSFEEAVRGEKSRRVPNGRGLVSALDSMVDDLLEGGGSPLLAGGGDGKVDLSSRFLPRDATSLVRLLGRAGAHDAMLKFCRRYCRDITSASSGGSAEEAEDAVRHAYTAAIAAIARPPPSPLASSGDARPAPPASSYRSRAFLLSLLNEMERGYTENGAMIWPNSYTLSAVLLGIDDASESLDLLGKFEEECGGDGGERSIVTVQVYNVVIGSCSKDPGRGGWQRALSVLERMRRSGPPPDEQTYSMVLLSCAENGQVRVATSLLDEIRRSGELVPTARLYLPLLKACARVGNSRTVRSLLDRMGEDSLEVTTEVMNLYLSSLARDGLHLRALGALREMVSDPSLDPDIVSFNTVLNALARAGDYEGARALLDKMKHGEGEGEEGLLPRPDAVSYNSVISCAEDPTEALSLVQEMRLTRRNREGVVMPTSVTYVNAITRCRKAILGGDVDAFEVAMCLLGLAREDRNVVDVNVMVWSAAIWCAEAAGDCRAAVELLREMDCAPNGVCYDAVISSLSKAGLHREALYFYYESVQLGLSASRKTYQSIVSALDASREEPDMTCRKRAALLDGVLSRMPEGDKSVRIGGPLFEAIIRNYGRMDAASNPSTCYQAARKTFDSIVGPVDDACLSAMLQVCSSTKPPMWKEAISLIHSSDVVQGPGLVSCRALSQAVIACAKAEQWEESLNLMDLYGRKIDRGLSAVDSSAKQSASVSVRAVNSVIGACGKARPDLAVQLLNDMSAKYGVRPDEVSYWLAIIACNQAEHRERRQNHPIGDGLRWFECALSLLRRMKEDDIQPSLQAYSSVVSACEAAGAWQRAIGVLKTMPSFAPILGDTDVNAVGAYEPANLYCLNAAIAACEKGGAWVEALQLYENVCSMKDAENAVRPNFITVNSLLIALEKANQLELAESIYKDAVRDKIVFPWKRRFDNDGKVKRMMDLHLYSAPMAKIAVRSYMEAALSSKRKKFGSVDVVFIVGKGKRSEDKPVLMPAIMQLLKDEYDITATIDERNTGRLRIAREAFYLFVERKRWKL